MKKIFFTIMAVLAFTNFSNAQTEITAGPKFKFEEEVHDFGIIKQGADATCQFKFINVGSEALVISDCKGSCSCTIPSFKSDPVLPGAEGIITVKFDTKDKDGDFTKTVYIQSNATARNERYEIKIKGNVLAPKALKNTSKVNSKKKK
jgi:Protein of unknown function (DUF1573)